MYKYQQKKNFTLCEFVGGKNEISGGGLLDVFDDFGDNIRKMVGLPPNKDLTEVTTPEISEVTTPTVSTSTVSEDIKDDIPDDKKNIIQKVVNFFIPYKGKKRNLRDIIRRKMLNVKNNNVNNIPDIPAEEEESEEIFYWKNSLPEYGPMQNIIVPKNTYKSTNNTSDPYSKFIRKGKPML
jgi:hypothetical protein